MFTLPRGHFQIKINKTFGMSILRIQIKYQLQVVQLKI